MTVVFFQCQEIYRYLTDGWTVKFYNPIDERLCLQRDDDTMTFAEIPEEAYQFLRTHTEAQDA